MDKKILETLVNFGLVTNIGINAESYKDVNELISKGVITIPGAEQKIEELLKDINIVNEPTENSSPVEIINETESQSIDNESIIVEEVVEEQIESVEEVVEEQIESVEEVVEEKPKKSKKA